MANKTITIVSVIDVVSALADGSLNKNIYLLDNNKAGGSTGEGTDVLFSKAKQGDTLVWSVMPIEPEVYVGITDILIDKEYCDAEKKLYEGTDISYWTGTIKKEITNLQYQVKYKVGTREGDFSWDLTLVGTSV